MRKILLSIMILIFGISCGNKVDSNNENVIRVGMECGYAPFNWFQNDDKNGGVKTDLGYCGGYDVEIAKEIAKGLGKELVIVKSEWDALLGPAVNSGKIDLVIAGMTATPGEKQSLLFSNSYYDSDLVVVVKKDGPFANAKTLDDFEGAKVTGQLNTLHYTVIDQIKGVQKQTAMESFPAMIVALNSNKIDAYVAERPSAMAAQLANPNLTYITFDKENGFEYDSEEVAISIGMKLDQKELKEDINKILSGISSEKRQEIMQKAIENQPLQEEGGEQKTFFQWVMFFITENWDQFVYGTLMTLFISLTGTIAGFFIGVLVAFVKNLSKEHKKMKILNIIFSIYISIFRGTPMIVQSMIIYYGTKEVLGLNLSPIGAALFIVSINTGAYMSEIIRGGMDSIDKGQYEAAQAIGMTNVQMLKYIIFPQMFRNVLPAMGNEFIINIKDTSVLNVISVTELFFVSKSVAGSYSRYYEVFIITSVIYFFLTFTLSALLRYIERKIDGPQNFEFLDQHEEVQ